MMNNVTLGKRYRDTVSGWEGMATARYEYLNGCIRVELSGADATMKPYSAVFDVQQLEVVKTSDHAIPRGEPFLEPKPRRRRWWHVLEPRYGFTGGPQDHEPVER